LRRRRGDAEPASAGVKPGNCRHAKCDVRPDGGREEFEDLLAARFFSRSFVILTGSLQGRDVDEA
jgi:hypothetical protein